MGAGGSVKLGADEIDADAAKVAFGTICDELKDPTTGKIYPAKLRFYAAAALGVDSNALLRMEGLQKVPIGYNDETGMAVVPVDMPLIDARGTPPKIGPNGFQLVAFDHGIDDFSQGAVTQEEITTKLYPKLEALLLTEVAGATTVRVFNHGLRASTVANPAPGAVVNAPVKEAHSDFSTSISPLVARKVANDAGLELTQRFCLVNLWMSIDKHHPVMTTPLAFLNHTSVETGDILDNFALTRDPSTRPEWSGQMMRSYRALLKHNVKHEWLYYPKMTMDEAVIFKQFDSTTSESTVCVHAAVKCDEGPPPLPPRQSIELRALILFG